MKQLWDVGLEEYIHDMWNVIDFVTNSLYVATLALRIVAYYRVCSARIVPSINLICPIQVQMEMGETENYVDLQREEWDTWDPMLIAEGLFSAANIFRFLTLALNFQTDAHVSFQLAQTCVHIFSESLFGTVTGLA